MTKLNSFALSIALSVVSVSTASKIHASETLAAAIEARMGGNPALAEAMLKRLIRDEPNNPFARFELGVAQADQKKCYLAHQSFQQGLRLQPSEIYSNSVKHAMADLCPHLAPFEHTLSFSLSADTNANSGANSGIIQIGDETLYLSDDAVKRSAVSFQIGTSVGYNIPISDFASVRRCCRNAA